MKGSEIKLARYMQGASKRFVIPVYQRNYEWKIENCKQLYDDLVKVIKNGRAISSAVLYPYMMTTVKMRSTL